MARATPPLPRIITSSCDSCGLVRVLAGVRAEEILQRFDGRGIIGVERGVCVVNLAHQCVRGVGGLHVGIALLRQRRRFLLVRENVTL